MASSIDFVEYVCGQIAQAGEISARKMFGEYCLYVGAKPIGLVCDNQFFLKITPAVQALMPDAMLGAPYKGAKLHFILDDLENTSFLAEIIRATVAALPEPKPKKKK